MFSQLPHYLIYISTTALPNLTFSLAAELTIDADFGNLGDTIVVEPADFSCYSTKNLDGSLPPGCRYSDMDSEEFCYSYLQTELQLD